MIEKIYNFIVDGTIGIVNAWIKNDCKEEIEITLEMVTGYDNTVVGKQTITVTLKFKEENYELCK